MTDRDIIRIWHDCTIPSIRKRIEKDYMFTPEKNPKDLKVGDSIITDYNYNSRGKLLMVRGFRGDELVQVSAGGHWNRKHTIRVNINKKPKS